MDLSDTDDILLRLRQCVAGAYSSPGSKSRCKWKCHEIFEVLKQHELLEHMFDDRPLPKMYVKGGRGRV